jgi:hypothetical protein
MHSVFQLGWMHCSKAEIENQHSEAFAQIEKAVNPISIIAFLQLNH